MIAICEYCKEKLEVQAFHPTRRSIKFCSFLCGKKYLTKRPAGRLSAANRKKLNEEQRANIIGGGLGGVQIL